VRIYGDPVLRQRAANVTSFDAELRQLVEDMRETMHSYRGVGLAANQVGVAQRIAIVDVPVDDEQHVAFTMVNPEILSRTGSEASEEGCLSIPGVYEDVSRSFAIRLRAYDEHGEAFERDVEGYLARAIQHEIDHLDGILFVDRLTPLKRQFLRRDLEALARGEMPEGYERPGESI
jgi:peptide deformylase